MFKKLLTLTAFAASASVFAASDGQMGEDSIGSTDISIEKPVSVQITNVGDLDFGEIPVLPENSIDERLDGVCVFSSTSFYTMTIDSASGGDFMLTGQGTNVQIPFEFLWASGSTGPTGSYSPTSFSGNVGDPVSSDCFSGTNATIGARIQSADYNIAPPDLYTATVMLIVTPE